MLGSKHSEHQKRAVSETLKKIYPTRKNWKGGISKNGSSAYWKKRHEKMAGRPYSEFCEICLTPAIELKRTLHFDHDHITGEFRGWLCFPCNAALGFAKDDVEILQRMIDYLRKSKEGKVVKNALNERNV